MTDEEREALELEVLKKLSPYGLPNNPAQSGWSTEQIKAKFYEGLFYLYQLFKGLRATTEEVAENAEEVVSTAASKTYVDDAIAEAIANVYKGMGSVSTYTDLPSNPAVGDTYNVVSTGDNYTWTGEFWDKQAGDIIAGSGVTVNQNTISSLTTATDVVINIKD